MICVVDNFFKPWQFKLVSEQLKSLTFYTQDEHPENGPSIYPGTKTDELIRSNPLLESFTSRQLEHTQLPFVSRPFQLYQYGHLRLDSDNKNDFIHQDKCDWSFLFYLSETNLDSGTKFYTKNDEEHTFVRFVQNRVVIFDSGISHMAWQNHGKDLNDGRLTINGFAEYL